MHLTLIFTLGVVMGVLYAWRKTILTSMILHMLQNTMAITVLSLIVFITRLGPPLGVYGESEGTGCRRAAVLERSAAENAGLPPDDVITHVGGAPVNDALTLRVTYVLAGLDGEAGLTVKRGDESFNINVTPSPPNSDENGNEERKAKIKPKKAVTDEDP